MNPPRKYCDKWDAYYNLVTMEWLEMQCGDAGCYFKCNNRPVTHQENCECEEQDD